MHKEGKCSTYLSRICQTRRKQTPKYAKAYGKYFLLNDMAIKTCHLPSFPFLFYHIFALHTILSSIEYDPLMSEQYTLIKFVFEETVVEIF